MGGAGPEAVGGAREPAGVITFAAVYLAVLNLATFVIFGFDKAAAADRRSRVPERALLALAALGGSPGALLARPVFRHKTRKQPFSAWLTLIVFLQAATVAALLAMAWRGR
ncbi:hypothetical protein ASD21_01000 [Caulobacter sp. Root1455]|nr:hypothetical protein ASD21_01000 [Caulobacter sp. Root1455]